MHQPFQQLDLIGFFYVKNVMTSLNEDNTMVQFDLIIQKLYRFVCVSLFQLVFLFGNSSFYSRIVMSIKIIIRSMIKICIRYTCLSKHHVCLSACFFFIYSFVLVLFSLYLHIHLINFTCLSSLVLST
jgi:hypothetical protein